MTAIARYAGTRPPFPNLDQIGPNGAPGTTDAPAQASYAPAAPPAQPVEAPAQVVEAVEVPQAEAPVEAPVEAQAEARILMLASNNILKPSDGRPVTLPTQDMIIGLHHLTTLKDGAAGEGRAFSSVAEAILAHDQHSLGPLFDRHAVFLSRRFPF